MIFNKDIVNEYQLVRGSYMRERFVDWVLIFIFFLRKMLKGGFRSSGPLQAVVFVPHRTQESNLESVVLCLETSGLAATKASVWRCRVLVAALSSGLVHTASCPQQHLATKGHRK